MSDNLEMLVENFGAYVKAIIVNKIGGIASYEDIEDCISDVFLEICKNPESLPESEKETKYYINSIAKRRAVDYFRRITYRENNCGGNADDLFAVSDNTNVEDITHKKALNTALWNAVQSLGEPDTSIIVYRYFYRRKAHEIGKILNLTPAAVHKRAQRAEKKIKEILVSQGFDE